MITQERVRETPHGFMPEVFTDDFGLKMWVSVNRNGYTTRGTCNSFIEAHIQLACFLCVDIVRTGLKMYR